MTTAFIAAVLLTRLAAAEPAAPLDSSRCLTCHGMTNLAARESGSAALHSYSVPSGRFTASVHGRLTCQQCHADVGSYPHLLPGGRAKVTCAQECHARDKSGRPYTHAAVAMDFAASAHRPGAPEPGGAQSAPRDGAERGRGVPASDRAGVWGGAPADTDKPTCLSCHGRGDPHAIEPAKGQSPRARMALCADCHGNAARMTKHRVDTDAVPSYMRSFHYKAIKFGDQKAAVCEDCHTAHRILPPSDPQSSVAASALPATCGQASCHRGASAHFAVSGANHLDLRVKREPILRAEEWLFRILTSGTMVLLVGGIALDVQRQFGWLALLSAVAGRLRRGLELVPRVGRRTMRVARWLLVE